MMMTTMRRKMTGREGTEWLEDNGDDKDGNDDDSEDNDDDDDDKDFFSPHFRDRRPMGAPLKEWEDSTWNHWIRTH